MGFGDRPPLVSDYWAHTMHREIITIQVGQCGYQIANGFWSTMCNEHKISKHNCRFEENLKSGDNHRRFEKIHVYFEETEKRKYVPRTSVIGSDPTTIDAIRSSEMITRS